ncbi:Aste57867_23445 [Aphanomyces stellatus]|uniref:Aste57867_23445 protein n=1 Tax=Aphanomyces stellatus TaxID=120398 RepID=A0A485LNJ5_9STRA|nr:hypothetical protein As57867_023374 [Aphanomyces stellatus]VFU00091.1 Aste57867_23445 [Aphanomyces stellatus]
MPPAHQRVRMTLEQKASLCTYHANNKDLSLRVLATWAQATFKLPKLPSKASVMNILASPIPVDIATARPRFKTMQPICSPTLETNLVKWVRFCEQASLPIVTYETLRNKAHRIRQSLLDCGFLTENQRERLLSMQFSHGWATKFLKRNVLKSRRVHGEAASAPAESVDEGRRKLNEATKDYSKRDIYNFDESAYFYCAVPTQSISSTKLSGRKNVKKRLTVALAVNADGSHKLPLLFIGHAKMPVCLRSLSQGEFDNLNYKNSKKGWITCAIFRKWLDSFNEMMRAENRRVLLLLDNASSHTSDQAHTNLSNVKVLFLPPNTTAHLQPLDAGIIRSFKAHLRRIRTDFIVSRTDKLFDENECGQLDKQMVDELLYVDVQQAMTWAMQAWCEVTSLTVANCWRHTQILDDGYFELISTMEATRICPPTVRSLAA